MAIRFGIDLGGTKIEIIALADNGAVLLRRRVATPRHDYGATLGAIAGLVQAAEGELGQRGSVGIGIPGAESRAQGANAGLIKNANSTWLIGRPLRQDLQSLLQREVRIENDANCFALSEATDGAAAGADVVFGVILGTGVGGGIIVRGRTLVGANAIAGEWGHNPLPGEPDRALPVGGRAAVDGNATRATDDLLPACYCGRRGCIETFLSGPGLARDHAAVSGESLQAPQIAARAAAGDSACEATLVRYERRLSRALAQVINILDPDVIVFGGGLSNLDRLYESVPRLWGEHVFSDHVATRLVKNRHGDSSGVRGAAWL